MARYKEMKRTLIFTSMLLLLSAGAFARPRGGGFGGFVGFGPSFYGGPGFWGPGWGPYYGPYWGPVMGHPPNAGELKLRSDERNAEVFIGGSFAGYARDLKSMWIRAGNYDVEIRAAGFPSVRQSIYVIAGKTVRLEAMFRPKH
jgi:hypothetical protein